MAGLFEKFLSILRQPIQGDNKPFNPFALEVQPDDPPELAILAEPRARRPRKRGRTAEQIQVDTAVYVASLRRSAQASFDLTRNRSAVVGSKAYIWRGSGCPCFKCKAKDGKRISWDTSPRYGHAGVATCCPDGWCRCYPAPIIPR